MQHAIVQPNFETVWATLQENAEQQKETDWIVKENARKLGKLDAHFSKVVEYMVAPNLQDKFRELGLDFHRLGPNYSITD